MNSRIGDITDDYCTRCHRMTNHSVAAMVGERVASVSCRTCGFQHDYRGGKPPVRSRKPKPSAFDQVLAGIVGELPNPSEPKPRRKR